MARYVTGVSLPVDGGFLAVCGTPGHAGPQFFIDTQHLP